VSRPTLVAVAKAAAALSACAVLFAVGAWIALQFAVSGDEVRVPEVIGLPVDDARSLLEDLGIDVEIDPTRLPAPDLPADAVAQQDPGAGTPLKRMRRVHLMLAAGPADRELPTMVGDFAPRARIALEQQDIAVEYEAVVHSAEVDRDRIIAQEPHPAELPSGAAQTIRLLRSLGRRAPVYVMVDLIGRSQADVEAWISGVGFRLGHVRARRFPSVPPGTVVWQSPAPGFQVTAGAEIDLEVSR
jgi:serine/threonine-protein kinase